MSDPVSVTYVLISISMRYSLRGGRLPAADGVTVYKSNIWWDIRRLEAAALDDAVRHGWCKIAEGLGGNKRAGRAGDEATTSAEPLRSGGCGRICFVDGRGLRAWRSADPAAAGCSGWAADILSSR